MVHHIDKLNRSFAATRILFYNLDTYSEKCAVFRTLSTHKSLLIYTEPIFISKTHTAIIILEIKILIQEHRHWYSDSKNRKTIRILQGWITHKQHQTLRTE